MLHFDIESLPFRCKLGTLVSYAETTWKDKTEFMKNIIIVNMKIVIQYYAVLIPLWDTPRYNTDLDIEQSCCGSQIFFYHKILQRN